MSSHWLVYRVSYSEIQGNRIRQGPGPNSPEARKNPQLQQLPRIARLRRTSRDTTRSPPQTKRRRRARAAVNNHARPPRSPPPYLADQSSVFVTAMMATVTGERGHSLGVLTVSRAVFLSRRSHTRTCHMRAFRRCIRHLALLPQSSRSNLRSPGMPQILLPDPEFWQPTVPQAVTRSNHTCCFVPRLLRSI